MGCWTDTRGHTVLFPEHHFTYMSRLSPIPAPLSGARRPAGQGSPCPDECCACIVRSVTCHLLLLLEAEGSRLLLSIALDFLGTWSFGDPGSLDSLA